MATHTLSVSAVCPIEPETRANCGRCLRDRLQGTPGVRSVTLHFGDADSKDQATLELDYDPRLVPLTELERELSRAGVCCQADRAQVVLGIEGMVSPRSE